MTNAEIKEVMLNPTQEGLERVRAHGLEMKGDQATIRAIEKSVENIINAQNALADILAQYGQS